MIVELSTSSTVARTFDLNIIIIGGSTHIAEQRIKLLIHRVDEVGRIDGRAVVPLQVFTQRDLPGIAARCLLLVGIAPLCIDGARHIFKSRRRRVVDREATGHDRIHIDGAVRIVLAALRFIELIVEFEEGAHHLIKDLSIVIVCISQLIPVTGHDGRIGTIAGFDDDIVLARRKCRNRRNCHCRDQHACGNFLPLFSHFILRKNFIPVKSAAPASFPFTWGAASSNR